jgi:hypothetical protein
VVDTAGVSLVNAYVVLRKLPDSTSAGQAVNTKSGFTFKGLEAGNYLVISSYVGYLSDTVAITLSGKQDIFQLPTIRLAPEVKNLVEVIIRSEATPVTIKNDTIIYNATSFKTRPNATVEDLLKRLPGIQVDRDGSITLNGKKVEKVYIDGKEFSLITNTTITRNFTADMIDKVEGFDDKTEVEKATGINRGGNEVAGLNLKLKKDKKNGVFGKAYAAWDMDEVYSLGANLNFFKGERWLTVIANSNNSNNLFMGNEQKGKVNASPGSQKANTLNLNYANRISKKITTRVSYSGNLNENTNRSSSIRTTFLPDSSLTETGGSSYSNEMQRHQVNTQFEYAIDPTSSLQVQPGFAWQQTKTANANSSSVITTNYNGSYKSNDATTEQSNTSTGQGFVNIIEYKKRSKKPGQFFQARFMHGLNDQRGTGSFLSLVNTYLNGSSGPSAKRFDQQSEQSGRSNFYTLTLNYTHAVKAGNILDFSYEIRHNDDLTSTNTFNYNSLTGDYDLPDSFLTNEFKYRNTIHKLEAGYNFKGKRFNYHFGAGAQFSYQDNTNYTNRDYDIDLRLFNWFPRVSVSYQAGAGKSLRLSYTGSSQQPSIDQLQPLPDLRNPLIIKVGNPELSQQFNHGFQLYYTAFNAKKFNSLMIGILGNAFANKITPYTTLVGGGVQQIKYINVNGAYSIASVASYGVPLSKKNTGNIKLSNRLSYNHDINFMNGDRNITNSVLVGQDLGLSYHKDDKLFIDLSAGFNFRSSHYSVQQSQDINSLSQRYFMETSLLLPFNLTLASDFEVEVVGRQRNLPGKTISVWNASISKNLFRNKQGELRLLAFDLLNRNSGFRSIAGENYIQTSDQQVLHRLFLLSFIYNIKAFGQKSTNNKSTIPGLPGR